MHDKGNALSEAMRLESLANLFDFEGDTAMRNLLLSEAEMIRNRHADEDQTTRAE